MVVDGRGRGKDSSDGHGYCNSLWKQAALKEDLVTEKDCDFEMSA